MIINLNSQTELSGFYVVYEGSVNIEEKGVLGISHLMEHLLTKSFEHLHDIFETYSIGWNAYTSQNNIVFYFTGLDEYLTKYKKDIIESLTKFSITKEQFENEKKIVIEEYKDSFNDQLGSHYLNLDRKLFDNYNPIGKLQDLIDMKYMDILNFFEKQFFNVSKIINVSKNSEFNLNTIDFLDNDINKIYEYLDDNEFTFEKGNTFADKSSIICLSPFIDTNDMDDYLYIQFVNAMLSSGLNSPIFKEVREERQLVYSISMHMRRMNKQALNCIATLTSNDNVKEVIDTLKMIFKNRDKYLTKERFDIVKESVKISLEKMDINRHSNVNEYINPEGFSITKEFMDTLDYNKCLEIFDKYYVFDDFYISVDKDEFI